MFVKNLRTSQSTIVYFSIYLVNVLFGCLAFSFGAVASDRISIGIGNANDDIEAYRVSFQRDFGQAWFKDYKWSLSGYWDASINLWKDDESIAALALSPVFTFSPNRSTGTKPYIEVGVGAALISEREIAGRDLSSPFQFEDRIGFGIRLGEKQLHDINFRFTHYSNASLRLPNDGIDIYMLNYGYAIN